MRSSLPASASTTRPGIARDSAEPPPELIAGVTVTGATISTPGVPQRKLDANHATAFMQAWLPDSVFRQPTLPNVKPPTNLPVSLLDVTTTWRQQNFPLKVLYASDGTTAYVGMPAQSFGWAFVDHERWIAAPQSARVRQAFAGDLQPVRSPPAPSTSTTPTTKSTAAGSTGGGSGSSSGVWWAVGIAAIVVLGALALFTLRRRTAGAASAAAGAFSPELSGSSGELAAGSG